MLDGRIRQYIYRFSAVLSETAYMLASRDESTTATTASMVEAWWAVIMTEAFGFSARIRLILVR